MVGGTDIGAVAPDAGRLADAAAREATTDPVATGPLDTGPLDDERLTDPAAREATTDPVATDPLVDDPNPAGRDVGDPSVEGPDGAVDDGTRDGRTPAVAPLVASHPALRSMIEA